jgi:proliferating cell nuclear antigen
MSFEHRSSERFKDLLEALNALCEEVTFTVNPEGLTATQMDTSHYAMFNLKIPPSAFERWQVVDEQKFAVSVTDLVKKHLKNTYKDESVEISYDIERARLNIVLKSDIVREKNLPVLEPSDEEVPQPKIFFKAHARVLVKGLLKALKDFNELGEHVTISVKDDVLNLRQQGDFGGQSTPFEKYSDNVLELRYEEDSATTFTTSYLSKMIKALQPLSEVVNIDFSTDMPLRLSPELVSGSLEYYLAPCIGADEAPTETREQEEAYEEEVTDVSVPEELPQEPETEEPTSIPTPISTPAPASMPITIDMSVLKRLKM